MNLSEIATFLVKLIVFLIGVGLVLNTIASAIRTFILPRSAPDKIVSSVFLSTRFIFNKRVERATTYEKRDRIMALYAPLSLIAVQLTWLGIVTIGFTLIYWAMGFDLRSAFLFSESALVTLGSAQIDGVKETTLVTVQAVIGILLNAILIAYLPTIYSAFSQRETLVNLLDVRAGSPPTPSQLFQRFNRLKNLDKLHNLWADWEMWFAQLEETHSSLAVLPFFRSPKPERSWITAAGAVLDSAALSLAALDIPNDYQAALTLRAGWLALQEIATFFGIQFNQTPQPTDPISVTHFEFKLLLQEMSDAGLPIKTDWEQAWLDYAGWRVNYDVPLVMLSRLVMAPYAPWSSDRSIRGAKMLFKGGSVFSRVFRAIP